jgi:hypothetical protein
MFTPSANDLLLIVSSSSFQALFHRFPTDGDDVSAASPRRRGRRRRMRSIEKNRDWMKMRDVLRVCKIGIIRLLAPDVGWSILTTFVVADIFNAFEE